MIVTETQIQDIVKEKVQGTDSFIVDVRIYPGRISVLLDKPSGIRIEECAEVNRYLNHKLEESGALEYYNIEVSSPGMFEPLRVPQQYQRRIGKKVSVITKDGIRSEGILKRFDENEVELEQTFTEKINGKKNVRTESRVIPMNEIKETKVVFEF
jgi:ribosome maturation factor RimP